MSLDIVQGILSRSEITATAQDLDDSWGGQRQNDLSGCISMEMDYQSEQFNDSNILNADTSNWDPFDDADKFERLAAAQ